MQDEGTGSSHRCLREVAMVWEAFWVPWKEGCPPNITKLEDKHHDTLEPNPPSPVRGTSPSKTVDVVDHTLRVYTTLLQALFQKLGGVNALTTRENFFATDEEIKRVADSL